MAAKLLEYEFVEDSLLFFAIGCFEFYNFGTMRLSLHACWPHIINSARNIFQPSVKKLNGCQRRLIRRVTVRGIELTLRSNWIWRRRWSG